MGIIKKEHYTIEENAFAAIFSLLNHPGRIKVIFLLLQYESMNLKEMQTELGLSQAATSDLIKKLKEADLLIGTQVETSIRYQLNMEQWNLLLFSLGYFIDKGQTGMPLNVNNLANN